MLLVLTVIGLSALNTSNFEANIAGNERLYNLAFYNSDAGVDYFYGTGGDYLATPNTMGTIDSQTLGNLNLNSGQFNVTWRDTGGGQIGPPLTKEFLVTSEGIAPNFPTAGRVTVEAVIEVVEGNSQPQYQGGST